MSSGGAGGAGPSRRQRRADGEDLLTLTAELVAVSSLSRREGPLADRVQAELERQPWLRCSRTGDNVVARTELGRPARIVVAGHLDTVPPAGNETPRRDGDELWGLGTADMKGSLAVMLRLASLLPEPAVDVTWCFYAREEIGREHSGLDELWRACPELLAADAAILGEPTDARVEAGCQGTLRLAVHSSGVRAHSARPFTGRNAIHQLAPVLARVADWPGRRVTIDGCEYVEQLQAVGIEGGVAGNVVPDHASLSINYRFAPDRDQVAALRVLEELLGEAVDAGRGDAVEVVDVAEGAPPALDVPLLSDLVARSGHPPRAKVGWTDVASFWAHGIPAANFGAGDPLLAHHPDERVTRQSLERTFEVLAGLLGGS